MSSSGSERVDELASKLADVSVSSKKVTLESIAAQIRAGEIKNILVLTGAGISVSAGIPDFRSPTNGLYANLQKYNLPHPTAVFELDYFRQHPKAFFTLAKELYPNGQYRPTPTHYFIKLLKERGLLLRNLTQNIDGLEFLTGLPRDAVIQAHGGFTAAACIDCHDQYPEEYVKDAIFKDEIPRCRSCQGLVKPCITFFGESLPEEFAVGVQRDFPKADLLIVMGTSLQVQPFASLIKRVGKNVPRILINNEAAGESDSSDLISLLFGGGGGFDFKKKDGRDVFLQSDCDAGVLKFAELIHPDYRKRLEELVSLDRKANAEQASSSSGSKDDAPPTVTSVAHAADHVARMISQAATQDSTTPATSTSSSTASASVSTASIGVGFDFDHTLGLDNGLEMSALDSYMSRTFSIPAFDATTKADVELLLQSFRFGELTMIQLLQRIGERLGLSSDQQKNISVDEYTSVCLSMIDRTKPLDGVIDLLRWLRSRQIPVAILTNGWSPFQQKKIEHALGDDAPKCVLVSDELPAAKPSSQAFDALLKCQTFAAHGLQHSQVLYVGDNPAVDIGGAMDAGLKGVWFDWENRPYPKEQAKPTYTIHKASELKEIIDTLIKEGIKEAKL